MLTDLGTKKMAKLLCRMIDDKCKRHKFTKAQREEEYERVLQIMREVMLK